MSKLRGIIEKLINKCIVSCQALEDEPLYGSHYMAAMAVAAEQGGAAGIRANTPVDIRAIKERCSLPVIGLYKANYAHSEVFITPTYLEAKQVADAGAEFVAIDATSRPRPEGETLRGLIQDLRSSDPHVGIVADVSTFDEGVAAMELGVDLICTTLSGYTSNSVPRDDPDIELVMRLSELNRTPIIAEGRIWTPNDVLACFEAGAYAVVIGTAVTRPKEITQRFVRAMSSGK